MVLVLVKDGRNMGLWVLAAELLLHEARLMVAQQPQACVYRQQIMWHPPVSACRC